MFQEVVLISRRTNNEPTFRIVRARPVGRAYVWCDPTDPGAGGVTLLFEGEDGRWFVQEINHFPKSGFLATSYSFEDFEDAKWTFLDEVTYILS